jgi:hypothetical protein
VKRFDRDVRFDEGVHAAFADAARVEGDDTLDARRHRDYGV